MHVFSEVFDLKPTSAVTLIRQSAVGFLGSTRPRVPIAAPSPQ
jgi:hypothetical protein